MLKILHIADVHIDSPMKKLPYIRAREFKLKLRETFSAAIKFAKKEKCQIILIAGDLFDTEFYSRDTVEFLYREFKNAHEIRFVISPGNHDPYTESSPYAETFPENVFVFKSEDISSFVFPELNATVYGYAFSSHTYLERPIEGFSARYGTYNILCAHADTDNPISPYAPISASEFASSGVDYAALGHIHTKRDIMNSGRTVYAYSGCLAGRDFGEAGEMGGVLVTIDGAPGNASVSCKRVVLCPWIYEEVRFDVTGIDKTEIADRVRENITSDSMKKERIIRLVLCGLSSDASSENELVSSLSDLGVTEVSDETVALPPEGAEQDLTVRGEFYRILKPELESPDPNRRKVAAMALKLGLSALEGDL